MRGNWEKNEIVFVIPLTIFLGLVLVGSYFYTLIEGWSYLDAVYFTVSTATTLGYGDFVPITPLGKIFTIIFALLIISLAFYFFTLVGRYFIFRGKRIQLVSSGRIKKGNSGMRNIKT
jgi:voltage-gated potassium channel Kch